MNDITRTSTELVIPFGKYKGRSVGEISGIDPQYLEWLAAQDWFARKYQPIYNIIAAPTDDMSPEHNTLQVKFLDDDFCIKIISMINSKVKGWELVERQMELPYGDVGIKLNFAEEDKSLNKLYWKIFYFELKPSIGDDYPAFLRQVRAQRQKKIGSDENSIFFQWCVVYENFSATSVTEKQMKQMFNEANISIIKLGEMAL